MKRLIIILIMMLTAMTVVKAQIVRTDRGLIRWGIKASVDLNLATKWHPDAENVKMYKPGAGFQIGGAGNFSLGKNFFLEPGVLLFSTNIVTMTYIWNIIARRLIPRLPSSVSGSL